MSKIFTPVEWSNDSNIYEINLRQYTTGGSFVEFGEHLERLRGMGVEILWFMPITPISLEKRKGALGSYYACSSYTTTNPEFGTLQDFKDLVSRAHSMGFKVIIDWVANHTGADHHWTIEHPDFYLKNEHGQFYDTHGWEDVIDLNYYNSEMRKSMISAMRFWVEDCNIDGFRADMAHLVPLDFWREARKELDGIRSLFWLAECEFAIYHEVFDASYTWNWMHKTESFCKGEIPLKELKDLLLAEQTIFPSHALRIYFTSNHDENSWNGTEYEKYGSAAIPLAVFSCTWDGIPLIYSGQEKPNLKRLPFFEKDNIEWSGQNELENFYKTLLHLRKKNSAMKAGDSRSITYLLNSSAEDKLLAFLRKRNEEEVLVLLNLSDSGYEVELYGDYIKGSYTDVFSGLVEQGPKFNLKSWEFRVLTK